MRRNRSKLFAAFAAFCVGGLVSIASADITGHVKLDGKAPEPRPIDMSGVKECADQHPDPVNEETIVADEKGNLANVVVFIKADDPSALGGEASKEPAVLDQKGCTYVPHVLPVMVGQPMKVKNDDPFLHNVHSLAQTNPAFNFGQPNKDEGKPVDPPKAPEIIKVKCDVHPWMSAWIIVVDNPFFGASKEDGSYTIKGNLPDGEYTLHAWHEKLGEQDQKITVKDGKATSDFTFKAEAAAAPANEADAKLASAKTTAQPAAMTCCAPDAAQAKPTLTAKAE
jgi:hypothetical protein